MLVVPGLIKRCFPGFFLCTTGRDWNYREFQVDPEQRIESTVPNRCVFPSFPVIYLAKPLL